MNIDRGVPSFRDEYSWMSNMHKCKVVYNGQMFPSSEHAYMYAKMKHSETPDKMHYLEFIRLEPKKTKNFTKKLKLNWYWHHVKGDIMKVICYSKFDLNPDLADKLMATGEEPIEEGNTWNDTYFGVIIDENGNKVGWNVLGRILEDIRYNLYEAKRRC